MATTRRENSTSGKQKGDTFTSNSSPNTQTNRPSDQKQVPNYLKPTICSSNEAVKNVKKSGGSDQDSSQRPKIYRGRSYEYRPTAARLQIKEMVSPTAQDKPKTYRPISFSPKAMTGTKPHVERVVRKPSAAKTQRQLSTFRSMKTTATTIPTIKKGSASSSLKKSTGSQDKKEMQRIETKHENEDIGSSDHEVEVVVVKLDDDDHHQGGDADDSAVSPKDEENEYQGDVVDSVEEGKDTVSEEQNVAETEVVTENKVHEGETPADQTQVDEDKENDQSNEEEINVEHDHEKDIPKEENETETVEMGDDNNINAADTQEVAAAAAAAEDGEEELVENRAEEDEEEEENQQVVEPSQEQEESVEESKAEVGDRTQAQAVHGNKESPTESSYNYMIEETANKLREERKNKVKALVGAFETVIDKETSNAK